jgi:hypothetical protein
MTTRRGRRALAAAGTAAAGVLVAGCTMLLPQQGQPAAAPAPPAAGAPVGPTKQAADTAAQAGSPIASQEVHSDGSTLRVDITGLTRDGRLITLTWDVTMVETGSQAWYPGTRMSANPAGLSVSDYSVSGVTLVEPVHAKRYLVARSGGTAGSEEDGDCVCATAGTTPLEAGDGVSFFATFTAPPADVTEVGVDLVGLGTFTGVPIS